MFWRFSRQYWADTAGVRAALLGVLQPEGQPEPTRQSAIRALCHLARHETNTLPMWEDADVVRKFIIEAAGAPYPDALREQAILALAAFASVPSLAQPMWAHEPTMSALVSTAAVGEPDVRRSHAIRALASLSDDGANAQTIWTPSCDAARAVLIAAASPTEVNEWSQAHAIRALSSCPIRDRNVSNFQVMQADRALKPIPASVGKSRFDGPPGQIESLSNRPLEL